jgi:tyrosyl-DNA phosphodiesterase-1
MRNQEAAAQYSNVTLHSAFLPEMFGTHHSKMLVVLRHDETAQVIIHTANMILRDWSNMTQGVWESPRLPLLQSAELDVGGSSVIGSGVRFKFDLLNYLRAYDTRRRTCKDLVDQLIRYDFSEVRGALVSSVPGRHKPGQNTETRFGWPALRSALKQLAVQNNRSDIVVQISSIATLGATDKWLRQTLFETLSCSQPGPPVPAPNFKVIFPTPDEIRRSLDGYVSGGSIHTKIRSPQQAKQLQYLMPIFHHWANDCPGGRAIPQGSLTREAGRRLAAPHIKTYIRYGKDGIDWALMTSANLSKQAWGEAANESGEVRLASYEIGVLQWPALYGETAKMIPAFRQDTLQPDTTDYEPSAVPLRIPYDLPLQRYESSERPWVATASYTTPDRLGQTWAAWS